MHRLYENEDISIFWDSEKCRHEKKCVHGSPRTFDPMRRPWIDVSRAETAEIWQAVSNCPSGALTCIYNHGIRVEFDEGRPGAAAFDGDKLAGECVFQETPEGWVIYHTEVSPEYEGKGIAKRLVYKLTEEAEHRKVPVIPTCSYAKKVLEK